MVGIHSRHASIDFTVFTTHFSEARWSIKLTPQDCKCRGEERFRCACVLLAVCVALPLWTSNGIRFGKAQCSVYRHSITTFVCGGAVGFSELGVVCLAWQKLILLKYTEKPGVKHVWCRRIASGWMQRVVYCTVRWHICALRSEMTSVGPRYPSFCHMTVVQSLQIQKQPLRSNSMGFQYPAWLFSAVWIQCCHSILSISFRAAAAYQNPLQFWQRTLWIASKCHCRVLHMSWKIMMDSQEIWAFFES